jgi:hypothetical protein
MILCEDNSRDAFDLRNENDEFLKARTEYTSTFSRDGFDKTTGAVEVFGRARNKHRDRDILLLDNWPPSDLHV